jgi:serine/threonine-protein kinase RsbT
MRMSDDVLVTIETDVDLVRARAEARAVAERLGFSRMDGTLIATAVSELGRNIVVHVGAGEILVRPARQDDRCGVIVIARDSGPGIRDVDAALRDGYATGNGLGLGLPGARRIMDEFEIDSGNGSGTTIRAVKWRIRDELEKLRESR